MKLEILSTLLVLLNSERVSTRSIIIPINLHIIFKNEGVDLLNDVRFFLYTQKNYNIPQQLWLNNTHALQKSSYDFNKSTKFITHGWHSSYEGMSCTTIRKAHDNYNIIVVDWGSVAKLSYLEAAGRIKVLGGYVAKMINFLESQGSDTNNMSLVGHSLGAQLMGLAGYQMINKVGHVVGLDPAGPGFEMACPTRRLSTKDGDFVEIIHTNMGNFGIRRSVGHVDYYPNGGGPKQPGCEENNIYCAHDRSYIYYAESLTRPEGMLSIRCANYARFLRGLCKGGKPIRLVSWQEMKNKTWGSHFFRTAASTPFGLGHDGIKAPPSTV